MGDVISSSRGRLAYFFFKFNFYAIGEANAVLFFGKRERFENGVFSKHFSSIANGIDVEPKKRYIRAEENLIEVGPSPRLLQ